MDLPKNIQTDHISSLIEVLANKITGSNVAEIKAINNNLTDKVIEGAEFVGLIRVQNEKYIVTEFGKKFHQAEDQRGKNEALRELLKAIPIYNLTTEYFHHNKITKPTKLDVGSYWNEHFSQNIKGMNEDDITSSIIFFLKFLELASLGKFINAGRGRETRIDLDMVELAKYVTSISTKKEVKKIKKKEDTPEKGIEDALEEEDSDSSGLSILKRLNPELVWSDLDSAGARKLIIDKINELSNQNIVLNAKVDEYQKLDGINAVLKEKVHNLKADNLFRASVNSIGGVILGAAITLSDPIYQIVGGILGAILIVLSIFLKQSETKKDKDD